MFVCVYGNVCMVIVRVCVCMHICEYVCLHGGCVVFVCVSGHVCVEIVCVCVWMHVCDCVCLYGDRVGFVCACGNVCMVLVGDFIGVCMFVNASDYIVIVLCVYVCLAMFV